MTNLDRLINLADVERAARRRLPKPVFDSIAGGAADEWTLRANRAAFGAWRLRPRMLVGSSQRDLSITVFGQDVSFPVLISPTGFQRMVHRQAELAMARAAGAARTAFALSTATSYPLEDVAAVAGGPRWFQLYMPPERSAGEVLVDRAAAAGYDALCVTVDTPMHSIRERDVRNRLTRPLKLHPRMLLACAARPRWAWDFARGGVAHGLVSNKRLPMSVKEAGRVIARLGMQVTYDDLAWLRERWRGPLIVKGVLRGDDCVRMLEFGVDGFVVSNHGGRQLDGAPPTVEVLPEIVDAVDGQAEVYLDSGVRRGSDVAKALALGARAVMIGRPTLYGLAVGGQAGVERVLEILRTELDVTLGLLGCPSVQRLDRSFVDQSVSYPGPAADRSFNSEVPHP